MFCSKCGSKNSDDAKFCKDCGQALEPITTQNQAQPVTQEHFSHNTKKPRSVLFYALMPIVVFIGIVLFWGVVNLFAEGSTSPFIEFVNNVLIPLAIGITFLAFPVGIIYGFYANSKYYDGTIKCGNCDYVGIGKKGRSTWAQVVVWMLFFFFWPITLVYYLVTHGYKCPKCDSTFIGLRSKNGSFSAPKSGAGPFGILVVVIISIAIIGILAAVVLASLNDAREAAIEASNENSALNLEDYRQNISLQDIKRSVVNIYCENTLSGEIEGGSGTMMTTDGYVLTAAHIFPQDEDTVFVDTEQGCLVTIPDIATGATDEMYWAEPIILQGISDLYDIAFMEITSEFVDEDGIAQGTFPQKFDSFWDSPTYDSVCTDDQLDINLGDKVRVLGYPTTSGGLSLTITEGIISALDDDGRLLTTAKIDSGNSGGIAVADNGCIIGMPIAVRHGDYQNLGQIIPGDEISKFFDLVEIQFSE